MSEVQTPTLVRKAEGEIWASKGYQGYSNKQSGAREGQKGLVGLQLAERRVRAGLWVQLLSPHIAEVGEVLDGWKDLEAMVALRWYSSRMLELTYRGRNHSMPPWPAGPKRIMPPYMMSRSHDPPGADLIWTEGSHVQDPTVANSGNCSVAVVERPAGLLKASQTEVIPGTFPHVPGKGMWS
ncbi:hypothetical protein F5141DRAFT_1060120 [Pisolithus sp. B1]|nr:hypothetical protein F5141DRAFT_1060120 [Pisolithus sp. B1]